MHRYARWRRRSYPDQFRLPCVCSWLKVGTDASFWRGLLVQISCLRVGEVSQTTELKSGPENRSTEALSDDFLRANQLAAPDKPALDSHHDRAVLFRKIGRLVTEHAVVGQIDSFARFDLIDLEAMKNLDQRVDRVLQIVPPLRNATARTLFISGHRNLFAKSVQMIVEINEIVNEWLLQRFVQEIVAIFEQLGMKRVEQFLAHVFAAAD